MLWKTDEKALLEKRVEDRGKLMLTGRPTSRQAPEREVRVHADGHRSHVSVKSGLPSLPRWDPASLGRFSVTRKTGTAPSANTKAGLGAGLP